MVMKSAEDETYAAIMDILVLQIFNSLFYASVALTKIIKPGHSQRSPGAEPIIELGRHYRGTAPIEPHGFDVGAVLCRSWPTSCPCHRSFRFFHPRLSSKASSSFASAWKILRETEGNECLRIKHHGFQNDPSRLEVGNLALDRAIPLVECPRQLVPIIHDCPETLIVSAARSQEKMWRHWGGLSSMSAELPVSYIHLVDFGPRSLRPRGRAQAAWHRDHRSWIGGL
jgi:hypothetical protein